MANYFEITVSGRQLAATILGGAVVVLVAFGLGVVVGIQEPSHTSSPSAAIPVVPEPTFAPPVTVADGAAVVEPTPSGSDAVATLRGDASLAAVPTEPHRQVVVPTAAPTIVPAVAEPTAAPTAVPTVVPSAAPRLAGVWVQVAAVTHQNSAAQTREKVVRIGFLPGQVVVERGSDGKYRVRVGPFPDDESAGRVAQRLRLRGFTGAFLVKE